jgi:hypothetical protein
MRITKKVAMARNIHNSMNRAHQEAVPGSLLLLSRKVFSEVVLSGTGRLAGDFYFSFLFVKLKHYVHRALSLARRLRLPLTIF